MRSGGCLLVYTTTFNITQFYVLPTQGIYMFCVDIRTNSDVSTYIALIDCFCNREWVCLLRGTDWLFMYTIQVDLNLLKG
jgi:hypothetical protein